MRLLLDTHIYLWWLEDHPTLSEQAKGKIANAAEVYVSSASIWEASIKAGIGKLDVDVDELVMQIEASGFRELPISARHAAAVRTLPGLHNDPFDRLLVAQAICEPLRLLTHDAKLKGYSELVEVI
ncbi:MAG: PilT protein domain protein [Noviherbaspirillum sp.]|jgi:PIN domain nuclease of toxin-antitoxin system|nr:PilT protein domain protein [Noviherbaspirillum sp.]